MKKSPVIIAAALLMAACGTKNDKNEQEMDIKNVPLITIEEHFSDTEIIEPFPAFACPSEWRRNSPADAVQTYPLQSVRYPQAPTEYHA